LFKERRTWQERNVLREQSWQAMLLKMGERGVGGCGDISQWNNGVIYNLIV
jgi:hypothetical protein